MIRYIFESYYYFSFEHILKLFLMLAIVSLGLVWRLIDLRVLYLIAIFSCFLFPINKLKDEECMKS